MMQYIIVTEYKQIIGATWFAEQNSQVLVFREELYLRAACHQCQTVIVLCLSHAGSPPICLLSPVTTSKHH